MTSKVTFIILLIFCTRCKSSGEDDLVDYYVNVIEKGINESLHYTQQTSAEVHRPSSGSKTKDFGTFDFIVVGSGPGGSVVASRLSEEKNWKVLLIEAGIPESDFSTIPAMKLYLINSIFNWGFRTTKQHKSCLGITNHQCGVPKGKALGGTSAVNGLVYSRGHRCNFDQWEREGNSGWSYPEVLPYFIKSENSQINGDPGFHGRDGYLNVVYHSPHSERSTIFLQGSQQAYPSPSQDYNGKDEFGAFYSQFNRFNQFRQSSSKAFLEPVMDRRNLKIITSSYVTKITINSHTKTATGVEFTRNGNTYSVKASKEVILSAGPINSPQILMLSGIGPRQHLQKVKISVVNDLPVGKNLSQHTLFYGAYINTNSSTPDQTLRESVKQFLANFGPLTCAPTNEALGFYKTKYQSTDSPDLELEMNTSGEFNIFERIARYTDEVRQALLDKLNNNTFIHAYIYLLKPESVGKVTLASNDPFKYPLIDSNCLDKEKDVDVMYEGIKIIEKLLTTEPFQKINASLVQADYPQCRKYPMGGKKYWACAFSLLTEPGAHQISTCRMGPDSKTSVVGSRGNVHGIKRLRVCDSSIIPLSLAGHPAAPAFMIGERISDYIKQDHGLTVDPITNVID